jgi:hypothetical protein
MAESELDRLQRRLTWEGAEPLAQLSGRAKDALTARGAELVTWARQMAEGRPLMSLWIAFQIGFAVGRWGPHRAKP